MEASTPMAIEMTLEESVAKMVSLCSRLKRDVPGRLTGDLDEMGAIIKDEMGSALKASPDAALLVIETLSKLNTQRCRKMQCVHLLLKMQEVGPAVSPEVREKALRFAEELKKKLPVRVYGNCMACIVFLELMVAYHLIPMFNGDVDLLLGLFSRIGRYKNVHELLNKFQLTQYMPELIEKMICNIRHTDAVKFAYIYNLVDKFPPAPLLLAYLKDMKKEVDGQRKKGKASYATAVELGAFGCVFKAVKDYKIENFPCQIFEKRMDQLKREFIAEEEKFRTNKKRSSAVYDSSNPKDEQPNKRSLTALGASFQILCLEEKTPLKG